MGRGPLWESVRAFSTIRLGRFLNPVEFGCDGCRASRQGSDGGLGPHDVAE